jgi:hypothetical protein
MAGQVDRDQDRGREIRPKRPGQEQQRLAATGGCVDGQDVAVGHAALRQYIDCKPGDTFRFPVGDGSGA